MWAVVLTDVLIASFPKVFRRQKTIADALTRRRDLMLPPNQVTGRDLSGEASPLVRFVSVPS